MVRSNVFLSAVIFSTMVFLVGPAVAFPLGMPPTTATKGETVEVRLTKSNACKPKYRHKKAAQHLRERAHCK
jgi:hypothetical protein